MRGECIRVRTFSSLNIAIVKKILLEHRRPYFYLILILQVD